MKILIVAGILVSLAWAQGPLPGGGGGTAVPAGDYYHPYPIWAANNTAGTAGNAWSLPSSSGCVANAPATTNVVTGTILCTTSQSAQFRFTLPNSWDTGVLPYIRLAAISTDTTSSHTIIPAVAVSCANGTGGTGFDGSFHTAQTLGTITLNGTALTEQSSSVQLNSTSMTNAAPGANCNVKVTVTGTATDIEWTMAVVTVAEKSGQTGAQ